MSTTQRPRRTIKRPDDSAMNKEIEELRAEIKQLDLSQNKLTSEIDAITSDPLVNEKRQGLRDQLKTVIAKQSTFKQERKAIQEQIKNVDTNLKRKIGDIQKLIGKNAFKSGAEIDARVLYLDNLVGAGDLKLAEERRYVKEMTSLRKLRKDFVEVEKQQEEIDKDKTKIAEFKKKLNAIDSREVQQEFEKIQKELDSLNASNKSIYDKRAELYKKRDAVRASKNSKYDQIKKLRASFDEEFTKFKKDLAEEQKKRQEEYESRQAEYKQSKLKVIAEQRLAEASVPAFTEEINEIHTLLGHFDPTYVKPQKTTVFNAAPAAIDEKKNIRQIEMPSDVVILKKEQPAFFEGSKAKKNKKKASKAKNFTVDSDVILSLTNLSIPLPTKTDDVPNTIIILKETLTALQAKQEEQTKVNIEKAKAEIAKLEAADLEDEDDEEAEEGA